MIKATFVPLDRNLHIPVIVLNWNGLDDTVRCLEHLKKQSFNNFQIHLIDNNSERAQRDKLINLYESDSQVTLYLNERNEGFARAHNQVMVNLIESGNYKYIALLNNDAFARQDWLRNLVDLAEREALDMVGSLMIQNSNEQRVDNFGHNLLNTMELLPLYHNKEVTFIKNDEYTFGACAGAALYKVEMLREIGLFDVFFDTGYEDAELGMRAKVLGYKLKSCAKAVVSHVGSSSINKIKDEAYVTKTQINIFYSYLKVMPWAIVVFNLPFIIFKYCLVVLINIFFGRHTFRRVLANAVKFTCKKDSPWKAAREKFQSKYKLKSYFYIQKNMTFFLFYDIHRFIELFKRNSKNYFEDTSEK